MSSINNSYVLSEVNLISSMLDCGNIDSARKSVGRLYDYLDGAVNE